MILKNEELVQYYFGAYRFSETEDGFMQAFQYTKEQMEYFKKASDFWFERCDASNAKTLEFVTSATEMAFEYKFLWIGSMDTIEMEIDGLISRIYYVKDLEREGSLHFDLPEGDKHVVIYLPSDATLLVRSFEVNRACSVPVKNESVLWLGDSITQGYGPLRSSLTYVSIANQLLQYRIVNQGIGGYVYDKNSLMKMPGYTPDKIIVSLGTNQYGTESMRAVEEYYDRLVEIYGPKMPILCITPIWRGDSVEGQPVMVSFCDKLKEICQRYENVTIVEGFGLVPHLSEYYRDNLHPNELGSVFYGRNLVAEIRKLGW